jgi:hypothetical protein
VRLGVLGKSVSFHYLFCCLGKSQAARPVSERRLKTGSLCFPENSRLVATIVLCLFRKNRLVATIVLCMFRKNRLVATTCYVCSEKNRLVPTIVLCLFPKNRLVATIMLMSVPKKQARRDDRAMPVPKSRRDDGRLRSCHQAERTAVRALGRPGHLPSQKLKCRGCLQRWLPLLPQHYPGLGI